jgi:SAM-dependent methyltransferase
MNIKKAIDPRHWLRVYRAGAFDRGHGTDTKFRLKSDEKTKVSSVNQDNFGYTTIKNVDALRSAIEKCPINIEHATFVDIGCGKGRPILEALDYPFVRVTGIELDPQIAEAASRNVEIYKRRKNIATPASIVCQDAASANLPVGNLFVFLNQPFGEATTEQLAWRLASHCGDLAICYIKPTFAHVFDRFFGRSEWPASENVKGWTRFNTQSAEIQ